MKLILVAFCAILIEDVPAQNNSRSPREVKPGAPLYKTPQQLDDIARRLEQPDLSPAVASSLSASLRFAGEVAGAPFLSRVAAVVAECQTVKKFQAIVVNCNDEYRRSPELASAFAKVLHTVSDPNTTFTKVPENEPVEFLKIILNHLDRNTSSPELAAALVEYRNYPLYRNHTQDMIKKAESLQAGSSQSVELFIEDLRQTEGGDVDWLRLRAVRGLSDLGPAAVSAIPVLQKAADEGTDWISIPAREAIQRISGLDNTLDPTT